MNFHSNVIDNKWNHQIFVNKLFCTFTYVSPNTEYYESYNRPPELITAIFPFILLTIHEMSLFEVFVYSVNRISVSFFNHAIIRFRLWRGVFSGNRVWVRLLRLVFGSRAMVLIGRLHWIHERLYENYMRRRYRYI